MNKDGLKIFAIGIGVWAITFLILRVTFILETTDMSGVTMIFMGLNYLASIIYMCFKDKK